MEVIDYISRDSALDMLSLVTFTEWTFIKTNDMRAPQGEGGLYLLSCIFYHMSLLNWVRILEEYRDQGVVSVRAPMYAHPNGVKREWVTWFEPKGFAYKREKDGRNRGGKVKSR
jgi:hypothetical protein